MNPFRSNTRSSDVPVRGQVDDPTKSCVFQFVYTSISLFHFIEFTVSLAIIGYGIAISLYPNDPQHGFQAAITSWATFMLIGSFAGILGVNSDFCQRMPLKISALVAPINASFYLVFLIIVIVEKDSLYNYFIDKHEQLHLSKDFINMVHSHVGYIYFLLVFFMLFEVLKVKILLSLREDLLFYDEAKRNGMLRGEEERSAVARDEWQRNPAGDSHHNNDLTRPLMSNHDEEQNVSHSSQWWEDEDDHAGHNNFEMEESFTNIEHESSGWLSRLSTRFSSKRKGSENSFQPSGATQYENNEFAPVNEDLEFQPPASEARQVNSDSNHTPTPPWLEDDKPSEVNDRKDLSWTKEN